jgi:hypothetical protein
MSYDDINRLYQQYLGRDASQEEANNWMSGAYGATDPAGIEGQIASSGEAQARRARPGGGPPETVPGAGTVGTPFGGDGTAPAGGGNDWGAGTTTSPFGPWQGRFTAPTPQNLPDAPVFTAPAYTPPPAFAYDASHPAPTYTPPPAFSYGDFKAPSYEAAMADPGYQFRTQQGQTALQNAAAAKGTLNDSGTLKALIDYGQGAASQEYQQVWNRDLGAYTTNRGNALDIYNTNYKTQYQDPYSAALNQWTAGRSNALDAYNTNYKTQYADPYAYAYQGAKDAFAPVMAGYQNTAHLNDLANTNSWNDYLAGWQDYEARRGQSTNFALQS